MRRHVLPLVLMLLATACSSKDAAPSAEGSAAAGAAGATASQSGDADLADVTQYRLSMDKLDKYYAAQRNLALKAKAMSPEERQRLDAMSDNNASLDDMTRSIEQHPAMNSAVRDAGLSPREFTMITMSMIQSAMAASVLQMRPNDNQDSLVREMKANPENIKFLRENEQALKQKQQAFEAEMKRLGVTETEG